jgi:superfamily II DNA/RNA helicase
VRTYEKREPGAARSDFKRDANYGKRTDRPARTYEKHSPAPVIDTTPIAIAEDNGFAALGLPAPLVERLARQGILAPFPIQTAAIPDALAGRDVLGRGQTGSGKTFAFGLPTLARLAAGERALARRPRALILTPTRELAMQISDALEPFVHVMGLRHKLVAGGMPYPPQLMALDRGVDLLIATPGRLKDLIERGAVQLNDIAIMILDEADHMAEMGFLPEITSILDGLPEGGQRLLFSATLDRGVDGVVKRYLTDPVTHSTDDATASVTTMDHHILLIDPQDKKSITAEVANREGRTLVFVRTKLGADRVAEQLREQGVFAAALHGGLAQGARNRVLNAFKDGSLPVLVATDVAARGIHVDDIGVVLQADPPADHKDYLHRSGRTARAGEKGSVITLALPHQRKIMERMAREAGVDVVLTRAVPGDAMLASRGACPPSGVPIPASQSRRLLDAPQRPNRRPFGGGGRGGHSTSPRRSNDGARGYRGSRD